MGATSLYSDAQDLNITGTRVSYECGAVAPSTIYRYYTWAEGCPAGSRRQAYSYLKSEGYFLETLPQCLPPINPNPPLGEQLSQEIPKGYQLIDENITSTSQSIYNGYGTSSRNGYVNPDVSGIRSSASIDSGYCRGLSAGINFRATEYNGILNIEHFTRSYRYSCDKNDTSFPSLASNEMIVDSWESEDLRNCTRTIIPILCKIFVSSWIVS